MDWLFTGRGWLDGTSLPSRRVPCLQKFCDVSAALQPTEALASRLCSVRPGGTLACQERHHHCIPCSKSWKFSALGASAADDIANHSAVPLSASPKEANDRSHTCIYLYRSRLSDYKMAPMALESYAVPAVVSFSKLMKELLETARSVKPPTIEPPLEKNFTDDLLGRVFRTVASGTKESGEPERNQGQRYAVIETAVRAIFYQLIVGKDYPALWRGYGPTDET